MGTAVYRYFVINLRKLRELICVATLGNRDGVVCVISWVWVKWRIIKTERHFIEHNCTEAIPIIPPLGYFCFYFYCYLLNSQFFLIPGTHLPSHIADNLGALCLHSSQWSLRLLQLRDTETPVLGNITTQFYPTLSRVGIIAESFSHSPSEKEVHPMGGLTYPACPFRPDEVGTMSSILQLEARQQQTCYPKDQSPLCLCPSTLALTELTVTWQSHWNTT